MPVHPRPPGAPPGLRDITSAERSSQISFAAFCPQTHARPPYLHPSTDPSSPRTHARTPHHSSHGSSVCLAHTSHFRAVGLIPSRLTTYHPSRLGGLNANEQRELEQRMQKRQVKEFVGVRTHRGI